MSHNIDFSNGRANIAFRGSRKDVWHHLGTEMAAGMTIEQWAEAAGLNWHAVLVPAIADLTGATFDHLPAASRTVETDRRFIVRNDTGRVLGFGSEQYQPHQPADVLDWFNRYIAIDDRFELDVAGSLRGGAIIWATATFNGGVDVAGEKHLARVLMSTTFDASGATTNRMTTTRVVCNNTLDVALADGSACVRTTHRSKFDAAKVGKELAALAQGVATYKTVGDALAQNEMTREETSAFFKSLLDIPFEAKAEDISGRKMNQFESLRAAYRTTQAERNSNAFDSWTALQAVTRYVDHDRSSKGGESKEESRFQSAQFGSGAALKGKAMGLLMPRIADKIPALAA
jgi:phage/plasmid-like protein (TIGR03299 family)